LSRRVERNRPGVRLVPQSPCRCFAPRFPSRVVEASRSRSDSNPLLESSEHPGTKVLPHHLVDFVSPHKGKQMLDRYHGDGTPRSARAAHVRRALAPFHTTRTCNKLRRSTGIPTQPCCNCVWARGGLGRRSVWRSLRQSRVTCRGSCGESAAPVRSVSGCGHTGSSRSRYRGGGETGMVPGRDLFCTHRNEVKSRGACSSSTAGGCDSNVVSWFDHVSPVGMRGSVSSSQVPIASVAAPATRKTVRGSVNSISQPATANATRPPRNAPV
jgi:hypothetical protein